MVRTLTPAGRRLIALVLALAPSVAAAQTPVTAPANKYTPAQDVQLGQEASAQVRRQFPLVDDRDVEAYVQAIGRRLVAAIPAEFQHPEFRYVFQVVNARDLNAFALPGGPMYINRGMIVAAKNEGEVAGVMAHEISHVALRHGTAQATKATPYEIGTIAGQILGAIVGGTAGQVIAAGSQFGIGTAFLRFGREYERQADILGAQVMARAGYDPRDMAAMFRTIEQEGGGGGPEWLSDHPNPGNRYEYITEEAEQLRVSNPVDDSARLEAVQAELNRLPRAKTMAQLQKDAQAGNPQGNTGAVGTTGRSGERRDAGAIGGAVPRPSASYESHDVGGVFRVSVPSNWIEQQGSNSARFAPEGAFGEVNGREAYILGVEMGVVPARSTDLQRETSDLIESLRQANPDLRQDGSLRRTDFAGRDGLAVTMNNVSETGEREVVLLTTALLDGGGMIYSIGVTPRDEYSSYRPVFQRINQSVQVRGR